MVQEAYGVFFVEHIELDLCVPRQVNRAYDVRGFGRNSIFEILIIALPSGRLCS